MFGSRVQKVIFGKHVLIMIFRIKCWQIVLPLWCVVEYSVWMIHIKTKISCRFYYYSVFFFGSRQNTSYHYIDWITRTHLELFNYKKSRLYAKQAKCTRPQHMIVPCTMEKASTTFIFCDVEMIVGTRGGGQYLSKER